MAALRASPWLVVVAAALVAGCPGSVDSPPFSSDATIDVSGGGLDVPTVEIVPDVGGPGSEDVGEATPDASMSADAAEDVSGGDDLADAGPELIEDVAPEVIEDVAPEVVEDVAPEVVEDVEGEVVEDVEGEVVDDVAGGDVKEDAGPVDPPDNVIDCAAIPPGPFDLVPLSGPLASEDLTFDDAGNLVGSNDKAIFKTQFGGQPKLFALNTDFHAGIRYLPNGHVVYADNNAGKIVRVNPEGVKVTAAFGFVWPNGIAVHPDGWLVFTDMQDDALYRLDPMTGDIELIADVYFPNGVAFGPLYDRVYVGTSGESHTIFVGRFGADGQLGPMKVHTTGIGGAGSLLDGIGVDACGNVYSADFDGEAIFRLPPSGGSATKIIDSSGLEGTHYLPMVQWGTGLGGWDPLTVYIPDTTTKKVFSAYLGVPGKTKPYPANDACAGGACVVKVVEGDGSCCVTHVGGGCDDADVQACVCADDPYCCAYAWDPLCVVLAETTCNGECKGCGDGVCTDLESCSECPEDCGTCQVNCCAEKEGPGCNDPGCQAEVCGGDAFCCNVTWDDICGDIALDDCEICQPECGDHTCEGGEDCDSCWQDCGLCCNTLHGDCDTENGSPGCGVEWCCDKVCDADPGCCIGDWDASCVELAGVQCLTQLDCPGGGGSCFGSTGSTGCDDLDCCITVCEEDAFCCETEWDNICGDLANDMCPTVCGDGSCNGEETCSDCAEDCGECPVGCPGAGGTCLKANGSTGCSNVACCEAICAADDTCCNIAWDSGCAHDALDLCAPTADLCPGMGGGCFVDNGTPGCADEACCLTVCAGDPFCCESEWDDICVDLAIEQCSG